MSDTPSPGTTRTAASIRRRRDTIARQRVKLATSIELLQIECRHPTPRMKYGARTGNYDPSSDGYWIDWRCPDCDKRWTTGQGREFTAPYPNAVKVNEL